ncbi:MAG: aspartate--tRNA ligase [Candidatus Eremiobacteraeota bacterium]|nr:aspartate--tRNA ligase [Candidatus Eremiobacteraeota bacterium]
MHKRSCGELRAVDAGARAELSGWVHRRRDHGGLVFIDVRDHDGITQIVFAPQELQAFAIGESLRSEDVVRVRGAVRRRPAGTENPRLPTGEIELAVDEAELVSRSLTPPFPITGDEDIDESLRLRYRYLDLRRHKMQRNLRIRHRIVKAMRDYFDDHHFLEIETPDLIKSTPEGARDYLVPSRLHPGTFYALPQSPQILKQICMIGGLGRYMQIARCFRDEDPRADRQPEFTQLDVEMSFVDEDEVLEIMEGCMRFVWRRVLEVEPPAFPRLSHAEAMRRFGSDKPDLRFGLELADVLDAFRESEFTLFRRLTEEDGHRIVALRYPGGASLSRREFDALTETAKSFGALGLVHVSFTNDGVRSPIAKFLSAETAQALAHATGAQTGDAVLLVGDASARASDIAGKLRLELGDRLGLRSTADFAFCWIVGFPLFERDPESGAITFAHHPFTSPAPGQERLFDTDPLAMRALHYDMVLNGYELGSGSIRNHRPEVQRKIFQLLGLSQLEIDERFGFFMEALQYGAPPHGGMALGVDRIAMIACGEPNIREVIAFPKNQAFRDMMMDAPSPVPKGQLDELSLRSTTAVQATAAGTT